MKKYILFLLLFDPVHLAILTMEKKYNATVLISFFGDIYFPELFLKTSNQTLVVPQTKQRLGGEGPLLSLQALCVLGVCRKKVLQSDK